VSSKSILLTMPEALQVSCKSIALRVLAERLARLPDITVGAINHPQSHLADFYRELGDIFDVPLRPQNRWGGFKALREQ
jgi:general secretion pathway protein A